MTYFHQPFFEPKPPRKTNPDFNENQDIDSGELDPETGERITFRSSPVTSPEDTDSQLTAEQKDRLQRGVCVQCGQDPCSTSCSLR